MGNDENLLRVGDDCRLNELGRSRSPKTMWQRAVVISVVGNGRSYRVLPNGRSEPARIHGTYLESIPKDGDGR
jgi:hypothetical protein